TTSYLYSEKVSSRIFATLPDVQLIFNLRNPVDRAFSHWWHGKSSGIWTYDFDEILKFAKPGRHGEYPAIEYEERERIMNFTRKIINKTIEKIKNET
ncbi:MAG: hypothetical protein ABEJ02_01030, partial [Candidatus Paceibacteria bacterium]